MTEVTQQEKREALARWEGWEDIGESYVIWKDPRVGTVTADGREYHAIETELPDYFHSGDAMLWLLEKAEEREWGWSMIRMLSDFKFVLWPLGATPGTPPIAEARLASASELPAAVAEAVYEAIS